MCVRASVPRGYDSLLLKLGEAQKEELLKCKNNNGCVLAALQSELEKVLKLLADSQQRVKVRISSFLPCCCTVAASALRGT